MSQSEVDPLVFEIFSVRRDALSELSPLKAICFLFATANLLFLQSLRKVESVLLSMSKMQESIIDNYPLPTNHENGEGNIAAVHVASAESCAPSTV